jgi:phosphotransferase system enzyme I (PtsI)
MRPPVEIWGKSASEGIFTGPVVTLGGMSLAPGPARDPEIEARELIAAIQSAISSIHALMNDHRGDAADILEFQVAMLEDVGLRELALAGIARGASARAAWWAALEHEIHAYVKTAEEVFSARAADLRDIRDRVLRALSGKQAAALQQGSILVGDDLPPSLFLETDWSRGGAIVLRKGSTASHVALLARARGVPMVVGIGEELPEGCALAIVDGTTGLVLAHPTAELVATYKARRAAEIATRDRQDEFLLKPARLRDGTAIDVLVNIASLEELTVIDPASCGGIGLVRSEFLFPDGAALPGEDEQFLAYSKILQWAQGRPVTIRTLDAGGDKPLRGLVAEGSKNPLLGLRGVRLTLQRPELFRTQLRALARAAIGGNLKVMLPMVGWPGELEQSQMHLDQCVSELQAEGRPCARPPLGIMVEVPAAAIAPQLFGQAAFFSIGTNDLSQFVTATSRADTSASHPADLVHPAVLHLIANVASHGRKHHVPVSVCGDMASNPQQVPLLIKAGITSFSVSPAALSRVKAALSRI